MSNVLRFNWHFFALVGVVATALVFAGLRFAGTPRPFVWVTAGTLVVVALVSLVATYLVYDRSGFYRLGWLDRISLEPSSGAKMANIHAGFDETTDLLRKRYLRAEWCVLDFYDPIQHTELSIRRARRDSASPDTIRVRTTQLPLANESLDAAFLILAAHEVRDVDERRAFFVELRRVLRKGGRVVVVEHLRDLSNLIAYSFGAFHFLPRRTWFDAFAHAGFKITQSFKPTGLMTCFVLEKGA